MPGPDQVPVLGNVAAGAPILAEQCIEEYLPYPTGGHPEEFFALRVRGESMLGAGIHPDDIVVVRRHAIRLKISIPHRRKSPLPDPRRHLQSWRMKAIRLKFRCGIDRKSTRLNSSHPSRSRMPSSA